MARKKLFGKAVDWTELAKSPFSQPKVLTEKQVEETYKRYNIDRFKTKEDYLQSNTISDKEMIEKGWKRYQQIDKLIRSGRYEIIRLSDYKKTYLEQYKAHAGYDPNIYNIISEMNLSEFRKLATYKTSDKSQKSAYILPDITQFYYGTKNMEGVNSDLMSALEIVQGLPKNTYIENIVNKLIKKGEDIKRSKEQRGLRSIIVSKVFDKYIKEGTITSIGEKRAIDYYIANTIQYSSIDTDKIGFIGRLYSTGHYNAALFSAINAKRNTGVSLKSATRFLPKRLVKVYIKWEKQKFNE